MLWAAWWFVCLIVMSIYTGNLTAAFTVDRAKTPFRTLDDLAEANSYKVGTLPSTVMTDTFRVSLFLVASKSKINQIKNNLKVDRITELVPSAKPDITEANKLAAAIYTVMRDTLRVCLFLMALRLKINISDLEEIKSS